jgi:hypothetical protein
MRVGVLAPAYRQRPVGASPAKVARGVNKPVILDAASIARRIGDPE